MDKFENINRLLAEQSRLAEDLAKEVTVLKNDDLAEENRRLTQLVADLEGVREKLTAQNSQTTTENRRLKNELFEQLFTERATLLDQAEKRMSAYFAHETADESNRLAELERRLRESLATMKKRMQDARIDEENDLLARMEELHQAATAEIAAAHQRNEEAARQLYADKDESFHQLKEEPLSGDAIVRRSKQNNWESLLGLKVFNKLGIILIIISVIAAALFPNELIPDTLRGVLMFILGLVMLVFGELINRKKPDVFSLGLTSGGVAVLYAGTALSFFVLNIIGMYPALLLCVLITTAALVLAGRYNSQTVAAFALIGGYLPLTSITQDSNLIYFATGYFVLLNIFSLSVACIKKWHTSQFIGFFLNLCATSYVTIQLAWEATPDNTVATPVAVLYVFFSFIVYTVIPLISTYRSKGKLDVGDNVLLCLNTFFGSASLLAVFWAFDLWDWAGVLAIGLGAFYLLATKLMERIMKEEIACRMLLCITGLAFAVLVIPLQFGFADLSLGWLIEGVLLLTYGILTERKLFRVSGTIICTLCLFVFCTYDMLMGGYNFFFKYLFVTIGALLILGALLYKGRGAPAKGGTLFFKCVVLLNLLGFLLFTIYDRIALLPAFFDIENLSFRTHYLDAMAIIVTLLFAYIIARWRLITDKAVRVISVGLYIGSLLCLLAMNTRWPTSFDYYAPTLTAAGIAMLVVTNLLAVLAMRDLLTRLILHRKLSVEWYPLGLSAFFVFLLLENLVAQMNLPLNSVIITIIFSLTSLGWVLFGFVRRYQYLRLFGLGLSFVTAIKLFLIDLDYLGQGMRIVSYFSLGLVLLAISFVYQYFSKRLDRVTVPIAADVATARLEAQKEAEISSLDWVGDGTEPQEEEQMPADSQEEDDSWQ